MSTKYWAGIVAGILAIFVVGMVVAKGIRRGTAFVTANFPASMGLHDAGFRVDGHRKGSIERLQLMRSSLGRVDSAVLTAKLADSADARFDGCILRVQHAEPFGRSTRFSCTNANDSARLDLRRFGHVEFIPGGQQVALFVPAADLDQMEQRSYQGTGSSDSGDIDIQTSNGDFSLRVGSREVVRINGDSNGGSLVIRAANGNPLVQINGDSAGGSVKVMDAQGHTKIDIHGKGSRRDSGTGH